METNLSLKNLSIGGISVFLGASFVYLLYNVQMGINFPLFITLVLTGTWIVTKKNHYVLNKREYCLLFLAFFFSTMVFIRSSELLTFFNVLATFLLLLMSTKAKFPYLPEDYLKVILIPFRFLAPLRALLPEIFSFRNINIQNPATREIIRGTCMAICAVLFFSVLLSSADPLFEKLVSHIFSFSIPPDLPGRLFVFVFVSLFFGGAFSFALSRTFRGEHKIIPRSFGIIETKIFLGSITALFLIFIGLQISYLFGGNAHVLAGNGTFAEYARKGFFELVLVAVASYVIISYTEKRVRKSEDVHLRSFKTLSTLLVLEVIVILVSAFERLSLYEEAYGFTTIRLYSHALMVWIASILLLLSHHILTHNAREKFGSYAFVSVVILLCSMNVLNPDVFIAKKNLERYQATGHIDTAYLAELSDDALPTTIHLLDDSRVDVRKDFAYTLYLNTQYCDSDSCVVGESERNWKSMRLSHQKATSLLHEKKEILEANKNRPAELFEQIETFKSE